MRLPYGILPLRLVPKTVFLPLIFLFTVGLGGAATLHDAFFEHSFFQAATWWVPWVCLLMLDASLMVYLHPLLRLSACGDDTPPNAGVLARQALHRLRHISWFSIAMSTAFLFTADALVALQNPGAGPGAGATSMMLRVGVNLAAGVFLGVLMHFFLENALYGTRKALHALAPEVKLPYQSLYFKIFLVLMAITVHLVVQSVSVLPSFIMLERPPEVAAASGQGDHAGSLEWMRKSAQVLFNASAYGAKDLFDVFTVQMLVYLGFIFVMLGQVKALIKTPLSTIGGRLADLNRGRAEDMRAIDVVQNDEFAPVFGQINRLIETQKSALAASQERLSHVLAGAADPIVVFDDLGHIRLFNPAAEAFFGYTADEVKSLSFAQLVDLPEDVACACETTALPLIHYLLEESSSLARHRGRHKDGTLLPFESNISTTKSAEGTLFTAILRDNSGQLAIEDTLTRAKVAAENANRMKSEFLANMSHELRTPLNAVLGFTQLLSNDKNLTDAQLGKIEIISRSGEHLLALINDILDISKIEAGKFEMHTEVFDLEAFVGDLRDMFQLRCQKKGLHLDVEILDGLPRFARGDLGKLRQVMINLVGNAVKFTSEGGVGVVVGPDGGNIRFSVNDSGKGIPAAELELILQPFTQSSNTDHEGGTGLGLTISHRFIEMMGGHLEVESQVGVGSTFAFALPLEGTEERPEGPGTELKAIAVKEGHAVLALIVDDKQTNRLILKEMLESVGFTTIEAENGREAVDRTREFRPRVVFMDIKMPVLDGYGAVGQLKAEPELQAIPVFALTASAFKHDEERIRTAGFDGFLAKPFKQSSLFRLIHDRTDIAMEYQTPAAGEPDGVAARLEPARQILDRVGEAGLAGLDEMALINDFTAIRNYAETLRNALPGFAAQLARLSGAFDEAGLEALIAAVRAAQESP